MPKGSHGCPAVTKPAADPPGRLDTVKAARRPGWPDREMTIACDHTGLLLLFPAIADLGLPDLVAAAGYPSTRVLSAWQSVGTLLAKCARRARVHHIGTLTDDAGLAFALGLTALPKATHLGSYSDPISHPRSTWRAGSSLSPSTMPISRVN